MATLRRNVVSYLYVVHCRIDGKNKNAFVQAESDATARSKAIREMTNEHPKAVTIQVLSLERIDPNDDMGVAN